MVILADLVDNINESYHQDWKKFETNGLELFEKEWFDWIKRSMVIAEEMIVIDNAAGYIALIKVKLNELDWNILWKGD